MTRNKEWKLQKGKKKRTTEADMTFLTILVNQKKKKKRDKDLGSSSNNTHTFQKARKLLIYRRQAYRVLSSVQGTP